MCNLGAKHQTRVTLETVGAVSARRQRDLLEGLEVCWSCEWWHIGSRRVAWYGAPECLRLLLHTRLCRRVLHALHCVNNPTSMCNTDDIE